MDSIFVINFFQGIDTLQDGRMRVDQCRVEPIVDGEAQIILVQLDQCSDQIGSVVVSLGKTVCLKLETARHKTHDKADHLEK